jgi:the GLUG motif protein family protein
MRNLLKRISALLLCLLLVLSLPVTALAEEAQDSEEGTTLRIARRQQFLDFAENCRLDSYSRNLSVILLMDIDLTGVDFSGIPIFCGNFDGNGHTVSGLSITRDGSNMGLFRYVDASGVIQNLTVSGAVTPDGSRSAVGGIAGHNAGKVQNCFFDGTVSGSDDVGGIAGINAITGIIDGCHSKGVITGDHRVGGVVGNNLGVVRSCNNRSGVNTTAEENQIKLSDISLETITGSESVSAVTDIGGIAGTSSGVIRQSKNRGNVGYQHMGYNVGGIAGTQTGYLYKCENFAQVYGRKEVGGIVGQMEPTTFIEYTEDTMQILQSQLGTVSNLTGQAFSTIQDGNSDMGVQVDDLYNSLVDAKDALDTLLPNGDDPYPPDRDTIDAAINNANSSLAAAGSSLYAIMDSVNDTADSLSRIMRSIAGQISAMSATVGNASQNLGGTIEDISDRDTAEILSGKVEKCTNSGAVLGDLNAGGVVGAIAYENRLDPENDLQIGGDNSMNFDTQLRAVILGCENSGSVTAKRQNVGGIVGWMALGLTKDCLSTGSIDAEDANYVGGVAGRSDGYIRRCSAKSAITGNAYVGGIAGEGLTVTDCRSMVHLTGSEKAGAILGLKGEHSGFLKSESDDTDETEEDTVTGNYYLTVGSDIGAIDGVSYADSAQPLEHDDFVELEGLDPIFKVISVRFVYDDGMMHTVTLAPGEALSPDSIPKLPEKAGYVGRWDGLADADLSDIRFDVSFPAVYTAEWETVQSEPLGESKLPTLLAQGQFSDNTPIQLTQMTKGPAPGVHDKFLEGYAFTLPTGTADTLRYLPETEQKNVRVMVKGADGSWREVSHTQDGSYLVFAIENGDESFCLIGSMKKSVSRLPIIGAGGAAMVVLLVVILLVHHRRKKKAVKSETSAVSENT